MTHSNLHISNNSRQNEILCTFKQLVEQNFQDKKTVNEYAQMMLISPKKLSETVKILTNHSALYDIHERMVQEAEYLLVYSNQSVKEISNAMNFENPQLRSHCVLPGLLLKVNLFLSESENIPSPHLILPNPILKIQMEGFTIELEIKCF